MPSLLPRWHSVKNPSASAEDQGMLCLSPGLGRSPGGGNSSILAWEIPWTQETCGLQSSVTKIWTWLSDWAHTHTHTSSSSSSLYSHMSNALFQEHKRRLYTWTSPDSQYQNQIDYILCSQKWRSSIQSAKTRLGADCGSDHKFLNAKFRLKLKKVRKTTRQFRYDLNQIPYDYTEEVTNRFKGLDLIEYLKNYGQRFMTLYRRQWSRPSSRKRKAKWLSKEALQIAEKRKDTKGKEEKKRYIYPSECRVPKNSRKR